MIPQIAKFSQNFPAIRYVGNNPFYAIPGMYTAKQRSRFHCGLQSKIIFVAVSIDHQTSHAYKQIDPFSMLLIIGLQFTRFSFHQGGKKAPVNVLHLNRLVELLKFYPWLTLYRTGCGIHLLSWISYSIRDNPLRCLLPISVSSQSIVSKLSHTLWPYLILMWLHTPRNPVY